MSTPEGASVIVLGIESSCDESGVALVREDRTVIAAVLHSQLDQHRPYGGVVPEIAARAHVEKLDRLVAGALAEAGMRFAELAGVAAVAGPGLIGGLIVGQITAKCIAAAHGLPFVAVNHLEAHALTTRLIEPLDFPYLLLLVSGGHCQLLVVQEVGRYRRLGTTLDDAVGEAFDKIAKMLGLGYPGGPAVEAAARGGDPSRFAFPRPLVGRPGCDFSLSGLKTAVRRQILMLAGQGELDGLTVSDICASFQAAVIDILVDRTSRALAIASEEFGRPVPLVVAGGVAANAPVRDALGGLATTRGVPLHVPPPALCTDNGIMVAWAGIERLRLGLIDGLDAPARARWPLEDLRHVRVRDGDR